MARELGSALTRLFVVGMGRFELPTPCSQSRCATRLRHIPMTSDPG